MQPRPTPGDRVEWFSTRISRWTGSTSAFVFSLTVVLAWAFSGPIFRFSDTWLLVINTITNVVTFVMVFLIQRSQSKDTLALQIKLSDLLAAAKGTEDPIIAIEELSEAELHRLHARYLEFVRRDADPASVDENQSNGALKPY